MLLLGEILFLLLLLFYSLEFSPSALADGFSLEFEWQQVSKTRLRVLAVFSNAVVCIVSTRPPTSKSSRPFDNPLVIVRQLFQFSSKVEVLILLFTFLQIYSVVHRDCKVDNFADSLFPCGLFTTVKDHNTFYDFLSSNFKRKKIFSKNIGNILNNIKTILRDRLNSFKYFIN